MGNLLIVLSKAKVKIQKPKVGDLLIVLRLRLRLKLCVTIA